MDKCIYSWKLTCANWEEHVAGREVRVDLCDEARESDGTHDDYHVWQAAHASKPSCEFWGFNLGVYGMREQTRATRKCSQAAACAACAA